MFHKIQSTRRFLHLHYEPYLFKWLANNDYTNLGERNGFLEQIKQHKSAWELLLCMKNKKNSSKSIFRNQKHNTTPSAANDSKRPVIIGHLFCFTDHLPIYVLVSVYCLHLRIKVLWNKVILSWFCVWHQIWKTNMLKVFYLHKAIKCMSCFTNLKLQCVHYFPKSSSISLTQLVDIHIICHLDFTLCFICCLPENVHKKKWTLTDSLSIQQLN